MILTYVQLAFLGLKIGIGLFAIVWVLSKWAEEDE